MRKRPSVRDAIRKHIEICLALGTQLGNTIRKRPSVRDAIRKHIEETA